MQIPDLQSELAVTEPASSVVWHSQKISAMQRAVLMNQKPMCIWLTGLSGSGKSTIANALDQALHQQKIKTFLLDGDNIRHGLNKDLAMTEYDRSENIRRVGEVAKLMRDAGLVVICAFISPYKRDRRMVRAMFEAEEFIEVYVETSLEVCESRDPKGLYKKARQGLIKNFTGIGDPYEQPENPELIINTENQTVDQCVKDILYKINSQQILIDSSADK